MPFDAVLFPISTFISGSSDSGEESPKRESPNSQFPESSIYHKGEVLYGLQVAKRYATEKDCAIVVEGYLDL